MPRSYVVVCARDNCLFSIGIKNIVSQKKEKEIVAYVYVCVLNINLCNLYLY